jgi:hypothetical protein
MSEAIDEDRAWTLENVRELQELIREKVPASLISMRLRRSQSDIHQKASELGLALPAE